MKRVLIDTDVILDFFFDREPFSDDAAKVLSLCEQIDLIITRNIKDFKNSSLGIMTPGNYLKTTIAGR